MNEERLQQKYFILLIKRQTMECNRANPGQSAIVSKTSGHFLEIICSTNNAYSDAKPLSSHMFSSVISTPGSPIFSMTEV